MARASDIPTPPADDAGEPRLRLQLLGGFRVACGERAVDDQQWRLSKARGLVKLLALSPAYSLHREQVLDLLWPEMDPEAALNNLHQALFAARRTLASVMPGLDGTSIIRLQRQVLALAPPGGVWVDADAFEAQAAAAMQADDPTAAYAAIELYAGDLLPEDLYEEWAGERRDALRDQYLTLLASLARLHEARGEYPTAVDVLRRLIATEPAHEEAHRGLMRLYALTERQQQALRQYARLREILEREFDSEPAPETDRLYRAILDHRFPPATAAAAAPAPAPAAPRVPDVVAASMPVAAAEAAPVESDFVNRGREMEALRAALERAAGGQGQVVLLAGQPGIGKTRTASEAAAYARQRGALVLWGRCYEGEGAPAYWPWVQIVRAHATATEPGRLLDELGPGAADVARIVPELRDVLPDLPTPPALDPDQERFRLFDSMTTFLKQLAARRPLLLVLDDLHWADRSSLLLLEFLADELGDARLCLLGAYREEEVDRHHPLSRTLAHVGRAAGTLRLALGGLGVEDVARYSRIAAGVAPPRGLADAIWEQTEGNPFFMGEVVRLLLDEGRFEEPGEVRSWRISIPAGVRETVGLRLDRLSEEANRVLTVAAVAGREFALAVLERAFGLPPGRVLEALEEALAARVLDEVADEPGRFRFSHILIRQTLYEEVSQARRLQLHRALGDALEAVYFENLEPVLTDLAYHYYLAAPRGTAAKAVEYAILAGAQAMDHVAYADAIGHYERALQMVESHEPPDEQARCELLLMLGEAQRSVGDMTQARETFERVTGLARAIGSEEMFAQAALGSAETEYHVEFWYAELAQRLEEALRLLPADNTPLRIRLMSRLILVLEDIPDTLERRRELSRHAVEAARGIGDPSILGTAFLSKLVVDWTPENLDVRLQATAELLDIARAADNSRLLLASHAWRISCLLEAGEVDIADDQMVEYEQIATSLRQPQYLWPVVLRQAMRALMRGEFATAERLADEALAIGGLGR